MANTFAPNGFQQYQGTGSVPTYEQTQAIISPSNTAPIFFGDPIVPAASATGVGTGYITQGYGPVVLTVAATAIVIAATGIMTVTFSAATSGVGNLPTTPNTWAPPVGATLLIVGATSAGVGNLNGAFTVTSSTTTTAVCTFVGASGAITSTASGVVTVIVPVAGVFVGCKYLSTSQKRTNWSNYWPGSDSTGDVTAYAITDPNAQFLVQTANSNTTATAVGIAGVGNNIGYGYNDSVATGETNGNTSTGVSTFFADQFALTAGAANSFLPFRIMSLANYTPGSVSPLATINGNDATTGYNRIVVGFNNSMPRGFAGI